MNASRLTLLAALLGLSVGCGSSTTPIVPDAGSTTDTGSVSDTGPATDAPATCTLPGGGTCRRGETCRHPDGCNTCTCYDGSGLASCTLIGCIDAGSPGDVPRTDGGPREDVPAGRVCRSRTDCSAGEDCAFPTSGCVDVGYCTLPTPCFRPETWCGCDGADVVGCYPTRPVRGVGSCADAGVRACRAQRDCASFEDCVFSTPGCDVNGVCAHQRDCAAIVPYCGCSGETFMDCPSAPTRPWLSSGACATDGGAVMDVTSCEGAHIGRGGGYCSGPDDRALPLECCRGWDCDQSHALCDRVPPTCPPGEVPLITLGCYGPCVPATHCARPDAG